MRRFVAQMINLCRQRSHEELYNWHWGWSLSARRVIPSNWIVWHDELLDLFSLSLEWRHLKREDDTLGFSRSRPRDFHSTMSNAWADHHTPAVFNWTLQMNSEWVSLEIFFCIGWLELIDEINLWWGTSFVTRKVPWNLIQTTENKRNHRARESVIFPVK